MSGTYSGTLTGQVDSNGNFNGIANFTAYSTSYAAIWQGTVPKSGKSLGIQGHWTGPYDGSGTFSGTGIASN
jgi:hypothetical protein